MAALEELIPSDPELRTIHGAYLLIGGFVVLFSLVALFIKERLYLSEAFVATALGIVVGPKVLNLFDPNTFSDSTIHRSLLEVTRVVLVIQCMAAGVSLPGNYVYKEKLSLAMLLGPVMLWMWLVSALGLHLILGLDLVQSLVIGATITPTDPILANSIVQGKFAEKHIPVHVRLLLSGESAANDGLGLPLLLLPLFLSQNESVGPAIGSFLWRVVIYQVLMAVAIGAIVGFAAQRALKFAETSNMMDKESIFSFSIALGLAIMGGLSMLGSDDILASFVAGTILTWDHWFNTHLRDLPFQESIDLLLNLGYFVLFGLLIPWETYDTMPSLSVWRLILLAVWVIFLRRLPAVMLLRRWIPAIHSTREAVFAGWFGPIGGGAIFYSMLAVVYFDQPAYPMYPIVSFMVLCSIVVHGGTVSIFHLGITRRNTYRDWKQAGNDRLASLRATLKGMTAPATQRQPGVPEVTVVMESGRRVDNIGSDGGPEVEVHYDGNDSPGVGRSDDHLVS
ncbi:hypothetical protein HKX48_008296 [Thoreauomyces humboldtii]|nr:hypothetical protein HKX48_008296 [Thoreauomyces humboldtii]